jgi:beta-lactamase regulating signal transducer with metallopeptidase domain
MAAEFLTALIGANLAAAAAIFLVLLLRRPVRRWFGPRLGYFAWLAVPIAMLATLAPARTASEAFPVAAPLRPVAEAAVETLIFFEFEPARAVTPAATVDLAAWLAVIWAAGALAFLAFLVVGQARSVARFGIVGQDDQGRLRAANPDLGPALIGLLRPRIVLPSSFETRFSAREQDLILAHERAHLSSGDLWINALIGLIRTVCWFNPLVHIAAFFARVDQELACDAAVAARFPGERRTYAQALLKTQLAHAPLPLGCYWPGRSSNLLKERIDMLAVKITPLRSLFGGAALAALLAGAGYAAWAAQPANELEAGVELAAGDEHEAIAKDEAMDEDEVIAEHEAAAEDDAINIEGLSLTNADEAGADFNWGSLRGSEAQIRSAVAQGDPRRAFLLGGTAIDVAAAIGANGGPDAELLSNAETAHFVNVDGRSGLLVFGPGAEDGRTMGWPELDGMAPPPDAYTPSRYR